MMQRALQITRRSGRVCPALSRLPERKLSDRSMGWRKSDDVVEEAMRKSLLHDLVSDSRASADQVVPWFMDNMPADYFDQLNKDVWYVHLKALSALFEMRETPNLQLTSPCLNYITFLKPHNYTGLLSEMIKELPQHRSPTSVRLFTSLDTYLAVNVFGYGEQNLAQEQEIEGRYWPKLKEYFDERKEPLDQPHLFTKEALQEYLRKCPSSYLNLCSAQRFIKQRIQYEKVKGGEHVDVQIERNYKFHSREDGLSLTLLSIAAHNHKTRVTLETFSAYLASAHLDIEFLYVDRIVDEGGAVDVMSILVRDPPDATNEAWEVIRQDLQRVKWVDDAALQAFNSSSTASFDLQQAEILCALCNMLHGKMNVESTKISLEQMLNAVYAEEYSLVAADLTILFEGRFHPKHTMPLQKQEALVKDLRERIGLIVHKRIRMLFDMMLDVVSTSRKTNLFVPNRRGLTISVDPVQLQTSKHTAGVPYGVFFTHGRRCNLFHVRFREHSRGGMRVATPNGPEEYTLRSQNHYNEAYGLAATQQAKNKDIAEGGSKAVLLVKLPQVDKQVKTSKEEKKTGEELEIMQKEKESYIFRSVRMMSDCLLDLICPAEDLQQHIVAYGNRQEYIYLGPDEQILPVHINWITQQAKDRKLPYATAFMSSKPATGINHKEYGVTSEGVCIFLDVALRNIGLTPEEEPFTLKMTGGTSGDVAGNAIKILNRLYGENARIVGLVDHRACVEDPNGLDHGELLRLVNNDLNLGDFDTKKLSSIGAFHTRDTHEGRTMCDSMHNRIEANAFLPAGGLPNTIRKDNWEKFMKADGEPSAPLIVEAANIFIEQEARVKLTENGVLIVKDSSANKCGVICSSMEIMANLLLTEPEFVQFKEGYVKDVLDHLRNLARREADLMFTEYKKTAGDDMDWSKSLPGIAERISQVMNSTSDVIVHQLPETIDQTEILELAKSALLPSLRTKSGDKLKVVAKGYINNLVAKWLSSQLVYHEGLDYVQRSIPKNKLAEASLQYVEETKRIDKMIEKLRGHGIEEEKEIIELLSIGGPRVAVFKSDVFKHALDAK